MEQMLHAKYPAATIVNPYRMLDNEEMEDCLDILPILKEIAKDKQNQLHILQTGVYRWQNSCTWIQTQFKCWTAVRNQYKHYRNISYWEPMFVDCLLQQDHTKQ